MPYDSLTNRTKAGPLIPEEVTKEIFQALPGSSAVMTLARKLPNMARGQQRMPILSQLPLAYFLTGATQVLRDTGLKQTTEALWTDKHLYAEEIVAIMPVPQAVLDDAGFDIWDAIRPHIVSAIGLAFDQAVFFGTNAPTDTWPTNLLAGATAASHVITKGGIGDLYADILAVGGLNSLVEVDGFAVTGNVADLSMKGELRSLRTTEGLPIFNPTVQQTTSYVLDGQPVKFPMNGSMDISQALMFTGDWRQLVWSLRQDVNIKLLTEAVIQDAAGNIVLNLAQQDASALRITFRIAWQLPNPTNRVNATEATRYPFSVLIDTP